MKKLFVVLTQELHEGIRGYEIFSDREKAQRFREFHQREYRDSAPDISVDIHEYELDCAEVLPVTQLQVAEELYDVVFRNSPSGLLKDAMDNYLNCSTASFHFTLDGKEFSVIVREEQK